MHVFGHHVGVAAVDPVVEVVPHLAVALRGADNAGEQRHTVRCQIPSRLGEECEVVTGRTQRAVDDVSDRVDGGHRLAVGDGEAAADVDHATVHTEALADLRDDVQGAAQRRAIGLRRRVLAANVEAEPGELHTRGHDVLDVQLGVGRLHAEFRREVGLRSRITERQPHQQLDVGRPAREFLCFAGVLDDEHADARGIGDVDVHRLLDRIGVDAAVYRQAELLQKGDLGTGGDVEPSAADRDRRQHDRMRRRLDRVVQAESGQPCRQLSVATGDQVRTQHEQRCAVAVGERG